MAAKPATFEEWYVPSSYQLFVQREGVPLYQGSALDDLLTLPLGAWERRGGKAAYTRLGDQETYSLQVVEIPPQGSLTPEHHMYDAVMYVLQGRGATTFWQEGESKQTVEWHEGSLLAIPLNFWHQEFNNSGTEPCRMLFGTNMAQMINHYHNLDFIFDCPYAFTDRYSATMPSYYSDQGTHWNLRLYETNFIPDIRYFGLDDWEEKGHRTAIMRISMASTSLGMHILDVSEGTYVMAHRHGAGAHVMVVSGEGYELLYFEGEEENPREVALRPYAVIAPKPNEFHQHFNSGKGPLRQLAFRGGPARYGAGNAYNAVGAAQDTDPNASGYKIAYERESPSIRQRYYQRLEQSGIESRLPPIAQRG
jgi:mannose-6-phosphate isomerase-like protein (cupin superfamily)